MGLFGKKPPKIDEGEKYYRMALDCLSAGDKAAGLSYLQKGVELGNRHAMARLGRHYWENFPNNADRLKEAASLMEKAEQAGALLDNDILADIYDKLGRQREATERYIAAAGQGSAKGIFQAAYRLSHGVGTETNYREAARWYEKAAQAGDAGAMNNLANMYLAGRGVEKDPSRARELYLKAAELGDSSASGNIALGYLEGTAPWPQDDRLAQEYSRKDGGNAGLYVYAILLSTGRGGLKADPVQAMQIMQDLAKRDYKRALDTGLGVCRAARDSYIRGLVKEATDMLEADPEGGRKKLEKIQEMGFSLAVQDGMAAYRKIKARQYDQEYLKAKAAGDTFTVRLMADRGSPLACRERLEEFFRDMESQRPGWSQTLGRNIKYCDTCIDITGEAEYTEMRDRILAAACQEAQRMMEQGSAWAAYTLLVQVEDCRNTDCVRMQVKAARELGDSQSLERSLRVLLLCRGISQEEETAARREYTAIGMKK